MNYPVFIVALLICTFGAFGVVWFRNPVHSALSLVATLFGVAITFISLDAEFLAAVQVIVYAGAIVVMFLFVIMLLGVDRTEDLSVDPLVGQRWAAAIVAAVLGTALFAIGALGAFTGKPASTAAIDKAVPNVEQLARVLFTDYLYAFEITSVLLVIGVVGAVVLARHRHDAMVDDLDPEVTP